MNSKIFIISVLIILIVVVLAWYIIIRLEPTAEQLQQGPENQNSAVIVDDTVENITSDLNQITDDSAAAAELNTLEEQTNNF